MTVKTKYGWQPAKELIKKSGRSVAVAALEVGVTQAHLQAAVYGHIRPSDTVKEQLPKLLNVELEKLFTVEVLNASDGRGVVKHCGCPCPIHS